MKPVKIILAFVFLILVVSCINHNQSSDKSIEKTNIPENNDEKYINDAKPAGKCPENCVNEKCMTASCSEKTGYKCIYKDIVPCCGNSICEENETYADCPDDCETPPEEFTFSIRDKKYGCKINGTFKLNDMYSRILIESEYTLSLDDYKAYQTDKSKPGEFEFEGATVITDHENDVFCVQGIITGCEHAGMISDEFCWYFTGNVSNFTGQWHEYNFSYNPRRATDYAITNYIRPQDVGFYNEKINLPDDYDDAIAKIHKMMSAKMYIYDATSAKSKEYFRYPNETLDTLQVDCEDWATAFLSLLKNYDPDIKCYNLLIPAHITTLCKFDNEFVIYDQNNYKRDLVITEINYNERRNKFRNWFVNFFGAWNYPAKYRVILGAVDEKGFTEFDTMDDFYDWALKL
ncbi:hypothetical protein JXB41_04315 [Candidatus Woesearchaeota archaeon]|nr:hypothetical protein [Candidatus Woesearchaeota archaeon]